MNRNVKIAGLIIIALVVIIYFAYAFLRVSTKKHSPLEVAEFREGGLEIDVTYYRPYKKDRLIFGEEADGALQPFGVYWRLGANEATTIKINEDITFAGQPLAKGFYSIYAIPGKETWTVAVNSVTGQWGYAEPNYDKDVLRVEVPVTYNNDPVEQFTISFATDSTGVNMVLKWDTALVRVPIN